MSNQTQWMTVGSLSDLIPDAGVGARIGSRQVALFLIPELDNRIFAVSNFCPFSGVNIIARGIVGDIGGIPVVASPLYKQHFSLVDGHCLEQPDVCLDTWDVRIQGGEIQVLVSDSREMAA